jgi:hypothetical protein
MLLFPHDCNLKDSLKDLSSLVYAALQRLELLLFQYLHDCWLILNGKLHCDNLMPFFVKNSQSGLKGYITVLYRHRSSQGCRVLVNARTERLKPIIHESEFRIWFSVCWSGCITFHVLWLGFYVLIFVCLSFGTCLYLGQEKNKLKCWQFEVAVIFPILPTLHTYPPSVAVACHATLGVTP